MIELVGRLWLRCQRLHYLFCAVVACCLALTVLLQLLHHWRWVVASDSGRGRQLTVHGVSTSETVSLDAVVTSSWRSVTGINDVFISVKTTGVYHNTRIKLLQRTWLTLAQNQVTK